MKTVLLICSCAVLLSCDNPFAPRLNGNPLGAESILGDQRTIEGVFQNFKQAYAFRDTTIYGQLLASNFIFVYRDYEKITDVFWGRDDDIRATYGLFQNVQSLQLIWNTIIKSTIEPDSLTASVTRNFNLTVTFSANDILHVDGYANLTLKREKADDVWQLTRWQDESNF